MKTLTQAQAQQIQGAMASFSMGPGGMIFTTTGDSVNFQAGMINGIQPNLIIYADQITDLHDNIIFTGTEGEFCHEGKYYIVSPVQDGSKVAYVGTCEA